MEAVCADETGIAYEVAFKGLAEETLSFKWIQERRLRESMEAVSDTVKLRSQKPALMAILERRASKDVERFQDVLKAHGYFGGNVKSSINKDVSPVMVTFTIETGSLYLFGNVEIKDPQGNKVGPENPREIGITLGDSAEAAAIVNSSDLLKAWFQARGHPFPEVRERKVIVDHSTREVRVDFVVSPGPFAKFGDVTIVGNETVNEKILRNKLPWENGDPYDARLLEDARKKLANTLLFGSILLTPGNSLDDEGRLPITIRVTERKHQTIGVGARYRSEEGLGGTVSWENRNLFGNAEKLRLSGNASDLTSAAELEFTKPQFYHPDQDLVFDVTYADDEPDAYTSRSLHISSIVRRSLSDRMSLSGGLGYKWSRVEQAGEEDTYTFLYVPVQFDWNATDDLLLPTQGGRLSSFSAPFLGISGSDVNFLKNRVTYARYFRLIDRPLVIYAGRISMGFISGAKRDQVPPDERFYAGGGDSIRGYAYQSLGPSREEDIVGGRSVLEASTELRIRVAKRIDVIPFIDGGNAFEDSLPDVNGDLFWGAGIGVQYVTGIGPIRLDVAVPLNKREGIDDSYQVYISLGHSF